MGFFKDTKGTVAVEAGILIPLLITACFGFADAASRMREDARVERAAEEGLARMLVAPTTAATTAAAAAGASLLAPGTAYRVDTMTVSWSALGVPTLVAQGADGTLSEAAAVMPAAMARANSTAVYVRAIYHHTPWLTFLPAGQDIQAIAVSYR